MSSQQNTSTAGLEGEAAAMEYFERRKPSYLPYYIARHGRLARRRLLHARSKEHALKHIDIRIGWLALFWLLVFIIVMAILIALLKDLILTHISNPVATQILSENEILVFPDVTICPVAPFSNFSMPQEDLAGLETLKSRVVQKLKYAGLHPTDLNVQAAMLIQLATHRRMSDPRSYDHLMYCTYNGEHCSFANFTEVVHLRYLKCFTFSPREEKRRVTVGAGLTFVYVAEQSGTGADPYMILNDLESYMFDAPSYDGINIFVHNPGTFPGYEISSMPSSFAVHFGQIARIQITGLQFVSTTRGFKKCSKHPKPYKYTSFGGLTRYLEYHYTYEDCVANRKQSHILETCGCYSDLLHVPHIPEPDDDPQARGTAKVLDLSHMRVDFCRDLRDRTSQRARANFECHERLSKLPTSNVLDAYINPDLLWESRDDPDMRKKLRQEVCPVNCNKMLYRTGKIEVSNINDNFTMKLPLITRHMMDLNLSTLDSNTTIHQKWTQMLGDVTGGQTNFTNGKNIIIIDIRLRSARVDTWNEEVTSTLFALMANIGGTLGLCAGISFLSALFLLIFFGNAFYHLIMLVLVWFWWNIFQGKPKAAEVEELRMLDVRSKGVEDKEDDVRPFRSSGHMRVVSSTIKAMEKSVIYDPWVAAQMQYGRPRSGNRVENHGDLSTSCGGGYEGTGSVNGRIVPTAPSHSENAEDATSKLSPPIKVADSRGESPTLHTTGTRTPLSRYVENMLTRLQRHPESQVYTARGESHEGTDGQKKSASIPENRSSDCSPMLLRQRKRDKSANTRSECHESKIVMEEVPRAVPAKMQHFVAHTIYAPK